VEPGTTHDSGVDPVSAVSPGRFVAPPIRLVAGGRRSPPWPVAGRPCGRYLDRKHRIGRSV